MKSYNFIGYSIIFFYAVACMYFAPARFAPWTGLLIGGIYFLSCWFVCGVYLADILRDDIPLDNFLPHNLPLDHGCLPIAPTDPSYQ